MKPNKYRLTTKEKEQQLKQKPITLNNIMEIIGWLVICLFLIFIFYLIITMRY